MKRDLNIVLGTKGGIGKTTVSMLLCMIAAHRGLEFEYIELDNSNNTSSTLENSEVFKDKMISLSTKEASSELNKATWKALKEGKIVFIDVGGGLDSVEIITLIKEEFSHLDINYILPFENSYKQMSNLKDTYSYVNDPENTYLVKNKVIKDDSYIFFEGDKPLGVESVRKNISPKNKVFEVPLSDNIQIAEITQESMLDLAKLAIDFTQVEAKEMFMQQAEDMIEYDTNMQRYTKSARALKEIEKASEEFAELFEEISDG